MIGAFFHKSLSFYIFFKIYLEYFLHILKLMNDGFLKWTYYYIFILSLIFNSVYYFTTINAEILYDFEFNNNIRSVLIDINLFMEIAIFLMIKKYRINELLLASFFINILPWIYDNYLFNLFLTWNRKIYINF